MDTIIIPFFPFYHCEKAEANDIKKLSNAAWEFARYTLWQGDQLSTNEVALTKAYIEEYFTEATDKKRAFTALCQRVLLAQRYVNRSDERFVPLPSVWFNRYYRYGFAGTLDWLYNVELQRRKTPGYLAHIETLADDYYTYATKSGKKPFSISRNKLLYYHATSIIKLLCATITNAEPIRA